MNLITVLMFHAISSNDELIKADSHYAISKSSFKEILHSLTSDNITVSSLAALDKVLSDDDRYCVFTFDDGHISNYTHAFPVLCEYGSSADFFINTAYVGTEGYMNWSQLAEMHSSGMSIQSHGHHHYYFDELDESSIEYELRQSKTLIEEHLGSEVTIFAPPGGRITPQVKNIALEIGYTSISTSRPGIWRHSTNLNDIPRMPVLQSTTAELMYAWASGDLSKINRVRAKYHITKIGKTLLGNTLYDKLRARVLDN